jgi:hypothetical protein
MVVRSPLVIISGTINQLPPGDSIGGETDPIALASGNAGIALALDALASGNVALASGNAGIVLGLEGIADAATALASGNAALANEAAISGYALVPSGAFAGASASLILLHDAAIGSTVNLSGQGGLQIAQVDDLITISGGTGQGGGAVGSGVDQNFFLNAIVISGSYTIPSGFNAGTFGPVDVLSGVTVTTPSGSTWTVV